VATSRANARQAVPRQNGFDAGQRENGANVKRRVRKAVPKPVAVSETGTMDYAMLAIVLILVCIGVVMVFSASYMMTANSARFSHNPFFFFSRGIVWAGIGFVAMLILANFDYRVIRPLSWIFYCVAAALLIAVAIVGVASGGATRWLEIPVIGQFQPSELARPGLIFMLAFLVEKFPKMTGNIPGLAFLLCVVGLLAGLIALPGGLSVAIIVTIIGVGMIAIASPHFKWFVGLGGLGAAAVGLFLWWDSTTGGTFRGRRFSAWLDPFSDPLVSGYQIIQSLFAIASGGWFGLGLGQSRQASFVPEPHNDIIFAIIVEELGFIGAVFIILLFAVFIWRGVIIAMRAPDTFSSMAALGIVFAIGIQAVINIAVVTNSIPNTGVNLPFISYGGTSLIISMAMVGVLLNISKHSVKKDAVA